ncbi:MAG: lipid-binding SYLF domain-containing protein [Gammaproteobacteria bacterium]|nr:lipid-binding SYLF domain-containing protein [Gammaproteobacteria bacterium]
MLRHTLIRLIFAGLFSILSLQNAHASDIDTRALVDAAATSVETFSIDPDMEWLRHNMHKARAILIVPQLIKGGFFFGGSGGSGVLLTKGEGNVWSYPAFYTMGSGTIGFQAGVEVAELILIIMTDRGVDGLLTSSFKLGGDISIATGPIGAGAKAQSVDIKGKSADILAFSRTKGFYGGVSAEGAVLKVREDLNHTYYGDETRSPRAILIEHTVSNPHADSLRVAVARLAEISGP